MTWTCHGHGTSVWGEKQDGGTKQSSALEWCWRGRGLTQGQEADRGGVNRPMLSEGRTRLLA